MADAALFLGICCAWAVQHSVFMSRPCKRLLARLLGPRFAFFRLGFTLWSVMSFGFALSALPRLPQTLYHLHGPAAWLLWTVRIAAIALFLWTLAAFDLLEFIGVRQAAGYPHRRIGPDGETEPSSGLIVAGPYRLVRHPMYLAATAYLFANPRMTLENLLFAAFALGYFLIGSVLEERRLLATFGPAYRDYQRTVPRLIPWPFASPLGPDSKGNR